MQHRRLPGRASRARAATLVACAALLLTGCTAAPPTDDRSSTWLDRMQTVFHDEGGVGGGGGGGPGSVQLTGVRPGDWVAYAVCDDADQVHVRISSDGRTLAETDVPCGATMRLPIRIDRAGSRTLEIRATKPKTTAGAGWWSVQVDSTSWRQSGSFSLG